jgi:hypothetical protein
LFEWLDGKEKISMKTRMRVMIRCLGVTICLLLASMTTAVAGDVSLSAAAGASGGCGQCHPNLSALMPKGHPPLGENGFKGCLKCHGTGDKAELFATRIHLQHYGTSRFPGNCQSCHQIGQDGQFGLVGGSESPSKVRVLSDTAKKLESYFHSWGTSKYLDHRHAQKGLSCSACHGTTVPEKGVPKDRCQQCHGSYEVLSQKSQIHASMVVPHFSGGNDCGLCHRAHSESELTCARCHETMELNVP